MKILRAVSVSRAETARRDEDVEAGDLKLTEKLMKLDKLKKSK